MNATANGQMPRLPHLANVEVLQGHVVHLTFGDGGAVKPRPRPQAPGTS